MGRSACSKVGMSWLASSASVAMSGVTQIQIGTLQPKSQQLHILDGLRAGRLGEGALGPSECVN